MSETHTMPTPPPVPAAWSHELKQWAEWLRVAGKPTTTIYLRTYQVRRLAEAHPQLDPADVTLDDLVGWLAGQTWSAETRRSYRAALRGFFAWMHATARTSTNPAHLLPTVAVSPGKPAHP